ncbi:hypothetical protein [Oryzihumus sp.]
MAESASLSRTIEQDEDAPRATAWWVRLVLVLVFHAAVILGQWWALAPNPGDLSTTPGLVPGLLVAVAWVAWLPVLFQVSQRVNLWIMTAALFLGLAGQWVLAPAVSDLYHNFAMERNDGAVVTKSVASPDNGVTHATVRLSDGRTMPAVLTIPGSYDRFTRNARGFLQPVHFGPFVEAGVGSHGPVLVDPHGISPAVNADRDDTTPAGKRIALWWLAGALVVWIPIELLVLSALTRRKAWWGMPMSEIRSRQAS